MSHDPELFERLVAACTSATARVHEIGERLQKLQEELDFACHEEAAANKELNQYVFDHW